MLTNEFLPTYDSEVDRLMAVDEHRPLTQEERTGLYDLINGALPGSINIGESDSTYGAYMKARSHRSIDRPLGTNRATAFPHNLKSTRPATTDFYANVPEIKLEHIDVDCWMSTDVGHIAQEFDPAEFSQILVESSYVCPELHSEELKARSSLMIHEAPDTPQGADQSNIRKQVQGARATMFSPEKRRQRTSSARGEIWSPANLVSLLINKITMFNLRFIFYLHQSKTTNQLASPYRVYPRSIWDTFSKTSSSNFRYVIPFE